MHTYGVYTLNKAKLSWWSSNCGEPQYKAIQINDITSMF